MDWHGLRSTQFQELAETYGTPFFLYDADVVKRRLREVRGALEGHAGVYYAVKANPNLELLRAIRPDADGVDISSVGELEQAKLAGFGAGNMSFAGPAKSAAELDSAIRVGVGCISLESRREIIECARVARQLGKRAQILLRVNPLTPNRAYGLKMGGRPVQFGIDEEELPEAEQLVVSNLDVLDFVGVHVYAGSQCFEPIGVIECTQNTLRIANELEERSGLCCRKINFGGGFGISHGQDARELDIKKLASELTPMLREYRGLRTVELIFELGRYLVAEAGIYVTRVISSKDSRGKTFFVCDGGLHHHLAAAGTFGAALRTNFEIWNLSDPDRAEKVCSIAGPSCNPTDLLGVDISLPQPQEGSLLGVLRSGSYGYTASPLLFLGRPTAAELVRHSGSVTQARRTRLMSEFN